MRIIINLICICTILTSCKSQKFKTIKFQRKKKSPKYYMDVPKGYITERIGGGHGESLLKITYQDSSFLYITNFENTPNYNHIRKDGYYEKLMSQYKGDTLLLQGIDSVGYYWKNLSFGRLSVGYKNVSTKNKRVYDQVINSFRKKRKP